MRILNLSLEKKLFENGSGPQKRVLEYGRLFERFDLVVMTMKEFCPLSFPGTDILSTNSGNRFFSLFDAWRLGKLVIKNHGSDAVSVQDPFEMGIVGWLLARKFGAKLQVQLHGDFFGSKEWRQEKFLNRFRYYLGKFILRRAGGIRVVSERIKKSLLQMGISESKISVVPIFSQITKDEGKKTKKEGDFIFLTVGRLSPEKNIAMQIEAMAEILKKHPEAELWIAGNGPEEEKLKTLSGRLAIDKNIKFLGWQADLAEIYSQADAFLLTSNYEGWGLVAVEAAARGLPMIMTNVGCAGELIKNGESGIIIPVGGKNELIEAMARVNKDRSFADKIGREARQAVLALPDKESNLQMFKRSFEF